MFDHLFGSKTRVKLLSLFYNNPGRPYYVREITRKIDEQINSVRRELSNLLSIGIINSASQNNRLYYEVNPNYQYYEELRRIFTTMPAPSKVIKETREEDSIAKRLRSCGRVDLAFLTGNFVRQSHVGIDVFIVGDINKSKLAKVVAELETEQNREINYTCITPEDYNYRLSLNDRFLSNIMEAKKIVLIDGQDQPLQHTDFNLVNEPGSQPIAVNVEVD